MLDQMEIMVQEYEDMANSGGYDLADQRDAMEAAREIKSR